RWREIGSRFPIVAELIVALSLFGIRQNLIGFVELFELVLSGFVPWIYVRMEFTCQLAIFTSDVALRRRSRHPQDLVVILELYSHFQLRIIFSYASSIAANAPLCRCPGCIESNVSRPLKSSSIFPCGRDPETVISSRRLSPLESRS